MTRWIVVEVYLIHWRRSMERMPYGMPWRIKQWNWSSQLIPQKSIAVLFWTSIDEFKRYVDSFMVSLGCEPVIVYLPFF